MIPTLIVLTLRHLRSLSPMERRLLQRKAMSICIKVILLFLLLVLNTGIQSQETRLNYQVSRNGNKIGNLVLRHSSGGDSLKLSLYSEIKTRMIISISANGSEEARYKNGVLQNSSFKQTVNGKEKVNKQTSLKGSHYVVNNKGKESRIEQAAIHYNMICLYTMEPVNTKYVYSDKYTAFLAISKVNDHHYRIRFPDGNYNEYFYEEGICNMIKVENSLFSVIMKLTN